MMRASVNHQYLLSVSHVLRKSYCIILLPFFLLLNSNAFALNAEQLTAVYVYRLSENILFPNMDSLREINVHVIDDKREVFSYVLRIADQRRLHGKTVNVTYGSDHNIPTKTNIIYLAESKADVYDTVFEKTSGKAILLISNTYQNERRMMINLVQADEKLQFQINKANIINQNLGITPDIILLGGTEVDVAKLFKESQTDLAEQQKLIDETKAQQQRVEKELQLANKNLAETANSLDQKKSELSNQNKIISNKEAAIRTQSDKLNDLLKKESDSIALLEKQKEQLIEGQKRLSKLSEDVSEQQKALAQQKQDLTEKNIALVEQTDIISEQRQNQWIIVGVAMTVIFFSIWLFRNNRKTQSINSQLIENQKLLNLKTHELDEAMLELHAGTARMEAVMTTAAETIITIDDKGIINTFNDAAERMYGYASDEVIGQNIKMLMPEPFFSDHDGYLARYKAKGTSKVVDSRLEAEGQRKDGATFPMSMSLSEFHVGADRFFTGIQTDITEDKRAEETLKQNMNELERFNKLAVERELKMIELKEEINELLARDGQDTKYKIIAE